jgi:hypothetical protein
MTTRTACTRADLYAGLKHFKAVNTGSFPAECSLAEEIAREIRTHRLELAIIPFVRPARTMEAAYVEVFGVGLDGNRIKQRAVKA